MAMHEPGVVADVHQFVSDVIFGVDEHERESIRAFADYIEDWAQTNQIVLEESCFYPLITAFDEYDLNTLYGDLLKERSVLSALWVIFLRVFRMTITDDSIFKYRTLPDFLTEYDGEFNGLDFNEQMRLFYTANWMALMLTMVSAKRNKCLLMHIIPKLVEGFSSKYVTGSGNARPTADRVKIFEHEGNVKKVSRGPSRGPSTKPSQTSRSLSMNSDESMPDRLCDSTRSSFESTG